jgi:hypothetical protein
MPVVLLTGKAEPGDAEAPQISAVVGKPADARLLLGTIERVISNDGPAAVAGR